MELTANAAAWKLLLGNDVRSRRCARYVYANTARRIAPASALLTSCVGN